MDNGTQWTSLPEREVVSGMSPIRVRQPRIRHRDKGRFSSTIRPKYKRRSHHRRRFDTNSNPLYIVSPIVGTSGDSRT
jgi:hypothetical protein